jgi:hypothetical protein
VRCGEERRAVGKTGIGLLPDITTRSGEPQDRSPGPLRASAAPRRALLNLGFSSVGKGLTIRKENPHKTEGPIATLGGDSEDLSLIFIANPLVFAPLNDAYV